MQLCFHEDVYLVATLRAVGKSLKGPEGLGSVLAALLTAQIRSMITLTYQNAHTALRPSALHGLGGVERVRGALAPREVFLSPLNPSVAGHYCKGMSIHGSTLTAWSRPPSNRIPSPSPQKTSGGQRDTRTSGKFAASVASERFRSHSIERARDWICSMAERAGAPRRGAEFFTRHSSLPNRSA